MMKQVMTRAWEIAREGVAKFGGKVREYLSASLSIAWKEIKQMASKKAEIRFDYCKKHWLAKINGSDAQYKLSRTFLDYTETDDRFTKIVYADLEDGYYQLSKFGKEGEYLKIENGEIKPVQEKEVMDFFNAPKRGMSKEAVEALNHTDARYGL